LPEISTVTRPDGERRHVADVVAVERVGAALWVLGERRADVQTLVVEHATGHGHRLSDALAAVAQGPLPLGQQGAAGAGVGRVEDDRFLMALGLRRVIRPPSL